MMYAFAQTFSLTQGCACLAKAVWAAPANNHQGTEMSGPAQAAHNSKTYTTEEARGEERTR